LDLVRVKEREEQQKDPDKIPTKTSGKITTPPS